MNKGPLYLLLGGIVLFALYELLRQQAQAAITPTAYGALPSQSFTDIFGNPLSSLFGSDTNVSSSSLDQGGTYMPTVQPPSGNEVDILARTIWGEARGESYEGQQAVANVIINRVNDPQNRFPKTVSGVCLQPMQFSCWNQNDPNYHKLLQVTSTDPVFAQDLIIAQQAIDGTLPDITGGAEFYFNPNIVMPSWAESMTQTAQIGNHDFYVG